MKNNFLIISILCFLFAGCSRVQHNRMSNSGDPITRSLFTDKDRTISEDDIQKLLNGHFDLPDTLRVAVYKYDASNHYGSYRYRFNDELTVKGQQLFVDTLSTLLQSNPSVKRVNIVPSLIVSAQPTMTQLREAAVRLQCDALLVFSPSSDIYYKIKLFKKNETKAYATTEAFLMDIRTGLIPFSTVITKDILTQQLPLEEMEETQRRAQNEAVLKTLVEIGARVNGFLTH